MKYPMIHFGNIPANKMPTTQVIDNKKLMMYAIGTVALIIGALYLSSEEYMQQVQVKRNPKLNRRQKKKIKKLWSQYEDEETPPPLPKDK